MIGAPCASSAQTKCSWCPCILWKRTQMSAWMYSMMCPIWNGPLAYGSAVVTKILRGIRASLSAGILQLLELRLVEGLLVGLLARDLALIQQLLDRGVHGAHAELPTRLHGVLELVELALAYEVGGSRGVHQNLERRHAALAVGALQQLLRDDAPQRGRQHGAHVRLLVGGERVHHAVDGRRRAVGVQRTHDEDAHLRRGDGEAHGLEVAQLADQDHVGVFAQGGVQRGGEARAVHADLALADEAALSLVHELDRVLDGEDMALHAPVDVVDHRRERGGLARTGLAGHQDQSVIGAAHLPHRVRHLQLLERERLGGDGAEYGADAVQMPHDVDAEAPAVGERVGEVGASLGLETLQRRLRQDLVERLLDELRSELIGPERREIAEQADTRRIAGDEVQIRAALLNDFEQQGVDLRHAVRCAQAAEFEVGAGAGAAASTLGSMLVSVTYFWKARFSR